MSNMFVLYRNLYTI